MLRATVLIPTHEHAATLPLAVASVQAQGIDDIEILIVGDGVTDALRAVVRQLQAADRRIRFFDLPKGPRHGEVHRDLALREAQGRIVCYQSDDDLWLPGHLAAMEAALETADFVGAMQVNVGTDDRVRGWWFDLARPEFTGPWVANSATNPFGSWASMGFGLSFAGHRLDAYRRLPEGWTTTPPGRSTDNYMWQKFARAGWCRLTSLCWPVSLHFPAPDRRDWTDARRTAELQRWTEIISAADGVVRVQRELLAELGDRLLQQDLHDAAQHAAAVQALQDALAIVRADLNESRAEVDGLRSALAVERDLHAQAAMDREALRTSTCWRLTAPLRAAVHALQRLRSRPVA